MKYLIYVNFVSALLSFTNGIIITRMLSVSERGDYFFFVSCVAVITLLALSGTDRTSGKVYHKLSRKGQINYILKLVSFSKQIAVVNLFFIIIAIGLFYCTTNLNQGLLLFIAFLNKMVNSQCTNLFYHASRKKLYIYCALVPVVSNTVLLLLILLYIEKITVVYTMIIYSISQCLPSIIGINQRTQNGHSLTKLVKHMLFLYKHSFKYFGNNLANLIVKKSDVFILKIFTNNTYLGYYAVAKSMAELSVIVSRAINQYFYKQMLENKAKIRARFFDAVICNILFHILVYILYLILGSTLVDLVYGKSYLPSLGYLPFCLIHTFLLCFLGLNLSRKHAENKLTFKSLQYLITIVYLVGCILIPFQTVEKILLYITFGYLMQISIQLPIEKKNYAI